MRVRFVGYSGARPPVPGTEPVVPIDPNPDPPTDPDDPSIPDPLNVVLADGDIFHKLDYLAAGYNRFDVMCVGGAGGRGGGLPVEDSPVLQPAWIRYQRTVPFGPANIIATGPGLTGISQTGRYGGGGGGGGLHRVKGRLALLPTNVPVVVGAAGADGVHPASGADGGASSFGGTICRASGGKGGRAYGNTATSTAGQGGVGNAELAGGGANSGASGTWDGVIGHGGGGGDPVGAGGSGSVSSADPTTSGPGDPVGTFPGIHDRVGIGELVVEEGTSNQAGTGTWTQYYNVTRYYEDILAIPGAGGGAKPFLLNGETVQYGSKAQGRPGTGLVIVRLTYVIT